MLTLPRIVLSLSWLAAGSAAVVCPAAATSDLRYIAAYRVDLREQASVSAPVVGRLAIGSTVTLTGRKDSWCAVSVEEPGTAARRSGYVACQWLVESAPRIEALDDERRQLSNEGATHEEKLRLDERAFWLSPSLERWALLASDQAVISNPDVMGKDDALPAVPKLVPSDSFLDSLALLSSGTVVVRNLVDASAAGAINHDFDDVLHAAALPAARPSWFKQGDIDAVLPSGVPETSFDAGSADEVSVVLWHGDVSLLDVLSYRAKARMTAKIAQPWRMGYADDVLGLAGVGTLIVTYEPAAAFNLVMPNGISEVVQVAEVRQELAVERCRRETAELVRPPRASSRPDVREALVSWIGTRPNANKVGVTARESSFGVGEGRYKLVATQIDLDGDGQADFVVHEWTSETAPGGRLVHANIDGKWQQMFTLEDTECEG